MNLRPFVTAIVLFSKRTPDMVEDLRTGYMGGVYSTADSIRKPDIVESKKLRCDNAVKRSQ